MEVKHADYYIFTTNSRCMGTKYTKLKLSLFFFSNTAKIIFIRIFVIFN